MLVYKIITRNKAMYNTPEEIEKEHDEKSEILGLSKRQCLCHFFNSSFFNEFYAITDIEEAKQMLAIKEGIDMVQFENANYGFVAYYGAEANGFEIIG